MRSIIRMHYYPTSRRAVITADNGQNVAPVAEKTFGTSAKMKDLTGFVADSGHKINRGGRYLSGGQCYVYILDAE